MTLSDCLIGAWASLYAQRTRTLLSAGAIGVGVATTIAMLAVGSAAKERVLSQIRSMGTNTFLIWPAWVSPGGVTLGGYPASSLTDLDAIAIEQQVEGVIATAPIMYGQQQIVAQGANWSTMLTGTDLGYFKIREWKLARGRHFDATEMQSGAQVALLGSTVAEKLFGPTNPIDQEIRIGRAPFTVIGVMHPRGQSVSGRDQDDTVFVPLRSARQRILGLNRANANAVNLLYVQVNHPDQVADAQQAVSNLLRDRHRLTAEQKADFGISNLAEIYAVHEASARTTSLLLIAVASIALIAGGFGIASVMLASVTQRRAEIGLRVALGARTRDIVTQFLSESMTIAVIGAIPGVATGIAVALSLSAMHGWPVLISAQSTALTVFGSALIGLAAGLVPALRAARLDPIQALTG